MTTALIGHTGFVGSNLRQAHVFDDLYNSSNIHEIRGKDYELVVTAANRADSHRINEHGRQDRAEIDELIERIGSASVRKLVLISTVCVYPAGGRPDEAAELTERHLTPYGANRLHQERRLSDMFDTTVIRLPQLYGSNLKKGVVFDLANDYRTEYIRPQTEYQHYDVRRLWGDIEIAMNAGLASLNVATPPLGNAELAAEVFGRDIRRQIPAEPESRFAQMYTRDMTTRHAELFGGPTGYLQSRDEEIAGLKAFVNELGTRNPGE